MALTAAQYRRGGANGGITDADGRGFRINTNGIADTAVHSVSTSAPGSGATLAAISSLAVGGVYSVQVTTVLTGTAETALANARVRSNATAIGAGSGTGNVPTLAVTSVITIPRVTVGANGVIDVVALAAATAGSIYNVSVSATRVE